MTTHRSSVRTHTLVALPGVVAAASFLTTGSVAAADVTCGTVVTTDVRLTSDLIDCAGSAIVIGASGVTVDLAGHVLDGTGAGAGIDNGAGHDRIRVVDGTIQDFTFGIHLFETAGARVEHVGMHDNAIGVIVERSEKVDIADVVAADNTGSGIEITFSRQIAVSASTVSVNGLFGIVDRFNAGSRHERNTIIGNAASGLTVDRTTGAVVDRNRVEHNDSHGIDFVGVEDGVVTRNTVIANAVDGIAIDAPGNTVGHNEANGNGGFGIAAPEGTVDRGHNEAGDNVAGDCTGVVCG